MSMSLRFAGIAALALLAGTASTGTEALAATTTSAAAPAQGFTVQHHGTVDHGHSDRGRGGDRGDGWGHGDRDHGRWDHHGGGDDGRDRCDQDRHDDWWWWC